MKLDSSSSPQSVVNANRHKINSNGKSSHKKTSKGLKSKNAAVVPTKKAAAVKREVVLGLSVELRKESTLGKKRKNALKDGQGKTKELKLKKSKLSDNGGAKSQTNALHAEKIKEEVPLPLGIEMTKLLDIEFAPEDVGNALQFLEFCNVFGKALDIKKGEAEAILRALMRKQKLRRVQNTSVVDFQIKLLALITSDSDSDIEYRSSSLTARNGKNSWLKALEDLIAESDLGLKEFPLDWLNKGISGYYDLDLSKKLILLNFICDEALGTMKLRSYIEDQNAKFAEEKKAAKSKVAEAKEKERSIKQKLQDEIVKAVIPNGDSLSISEHDALLSNIKTEAAKAHTEFVEAKDTIPKRSHSVRNEPEYTDCSGKTFWKLRSYKGEYSFLLQDVKIHDENASEAEEKWFVYGAEQKDEVNKYISSRRD